MRRVAPAAGLALALALALAATLAVAAEVAAPPPALTPVVPRPLGPPLPSFPVTAPPDRNAFPADILARMRAALVARGGLPAPPRAAGQGGG